MVLVARLAPNFTSSAVLGNGEIISNFNFQEYIKGSSAILFFWPMDFTFVCPSELIAFNKRYKEFRERGVKIIGVSSDSEFVHRTWRNTPVEKGGIGPVQYPMVADIKHEIQQIYGVEHPEAGVALRASFLINKKGIVYHQTINDLPIGRNVDEMLRIVDALQFYEKNGKVCPAQWREGKEGIVATPEGVVEYLSKNIDNL